MPCESYKPALTDAAATKEALSCEVAAHVGACATCRAFFAEEQQLFAAIDSGVHAAANTEVPTSLFPRVRTDLDDQRIPNLSWIRVGAVLAGAALVLVSVIFLYRIRSTTPDRGPSVSTVAANPVPKESPVVVAPGRQSERSDVGPLLTKRSRPRVGGGPQRAAEVAVLVPAGQRAEVDKLLVALNNGGVKADDLLVEKAIAHSADRELAPLGIPEIQIKPLAAVSDDTAPTR